MINCLVKEITRQLLIVFQLYPFSSYVIESDKYGNSRKIFIS